MFDVTKYSKDEIIWLATHRCNHRHTYLEHFNCYLEDLRNGYVTDVKAPPGTIGFFDIETSLSNFNADHGIMLCYRILDGMTGKIIGGQLTPNELKKISDRRLVIDCIDDLRKFDKIVTYNGTGFDFPYVRTRALINKLPFPGYDSIKHTDVFYTIKSRFKLSRKSLEVSCRTLLGRTLKTHIGPMWLKVLTGDVKAMQFITEHCEGDVRDLKDLYDRVDVFSGHNIKSI